jgi:hypothetical protein
MTIGCCQEGESDLMEQLQERFLFSSGYVDAMVALEDHIASLAFNILFDVLQIDEKGMMDTEKT